MWGDRRKKMKRLSLGWVGFSSALIFLTGCTPCANAIPETEPTMAEIYETAMQSSSQTTLQAARNSVKSMAMRTTAKSTDADQKFHHDFRLLPNPSLTMYVYPHFSPSDHAPIPGYETSFSLYEKNEYAMAGEVNPNF